MILTCSPLDNTPFQFHPGSAEAIRRGCSCPTQPRDLEEMLVDEDCPLHEVEMVPVN